MILINMGLKTSHPDSAIICFEKALCLIKRDNAPQTWLTACNNMVYSLLDKGNSREARRLLLDQVFPYGEKLGNSEWMANLYDTRADVEHALGNDQEAFEFLKRSIEYNHQATAEKSSGQLRLLAALLDLRNKERLIIEAKSETRQIRELLSKTTMKLIILILLILLTGSAVALYLLRRLTISRGKQFASANKIIMLEENELSALGSELHDLLGLKMSRLHDAIEASGPLNPGNRELALSMADEVRDHLRNLSHRMKRNWLDKISFEKNIEGICREAIRFNHLNLTYVQPQNYPPLNDDTKIHLIRIVQELLTNAVQYAAASEVDLEIAFEKGILTLYYSDQGPGFDPSMGATTGIGITNIQERVLLMNGKASLDSRPGYGVQWIISVPV